MSPKSVTKITRAAPPTYYARHGTLFMLLLLIFAPIIGWGYIKAEQTNNNNIKQWLPEGIPETEQYEDFRRHFGSDEFAIVSWKGCELNERYENSQLELFAKSMEQATIEAGARVPSLFEALGHRLDELLTGVPADVKPTNLRIVREVITGPRLIKQMRAAPFEQKLTMEQILQRLEGIAIGKDHKTTCALLRLTSAGNEDRVATTHAILAALQRLGFERDEVHIGGDAVFNAMIDIESRRAIHQLVLISGLVAVLIALFALRSVKLVIMVFVTSLYAAALAQASVYFTGGQFNLVMVIMPVLVYVLTISAAVHMVNYYKDAIHAHGVRDATRFAMKTGWTPCTLAAVTTAVGLLSLTVSHVIPVRRFGQFGAMGIIASLLFIFIMLPVLFERYPIAREEDGEPERVKKRAKAQDLRWFKISAKLLSMRTVLLIACMTVVVLCAIGITRINTSVHTSRFFPDDHILLNDIAWLEKEIGPMVTAEMVITFDDQVNKLDFLERLQLVGRIQSEIAGVKEVGGTLSGATWSPDVSDLTSDQSPIRNMLPLKRAFMISMLKDNLTRQNYYEAPHDSNSTPQENWRVTARVATVSDTSYQQIMAKMKQRADDLLASAHKAQPEAVNGISTRFTGAVPLVHAAQEELLTGLFHSFLTAFCIIGVVMMILLRSIPAGLLSMVPNLFPAMLVFGGMSWIGKPVDVGAMLTASVAMGIAVDGTLHFLTWFRRAMRDGRGRFAAITVAYQRCGAAITQTAAIAGLGLLVFHLASFQPVSQFGLLMCLLLMAAWLGDLILLPSLLASPIGRFFEPRVAAQPRSSTN